MAQLALIIFHFITGILLVMSKRKSKRLEPTLLTKPIEIIGKVKPIEPVIETVQKVKELKIVNKLLSDNQIMGLRKYTVNQICLHYTQGGSFEGCYNHWNSNPERIGTNFVIDKDGTIYLTIEESKWAYQLGIRTKNNEIKESYKTKEHSDKIEQSCIGIEMVCEGEVIKNNKGYYFENGNRYIDGDKIVRLAAKYRGCFDFVNLTDKQYVSLKELLVYLTDKYKIDKTYNNPFYINEKALRVESGIFSHTCYRSQDKTDFPPLLQLINLLQSL